MRNQVLSMTLALTLSVSAVTHGSSQDDAPRQLWDAQFLKKRTPAKSPSSSPRKAPGYRRATPRTEAIAETSSSEVVGLTIWRLRPTLAADSKDARLLLVEEAGSEATEFTPERVEAETPFAAGDRVRLSIESPRDGFLYVIDREQYADGTLSEPYLIFPTLRTRNGDNAVKAGKVIELPGRSAFKLTPMGPNYQGEVLTMIVSPVPLSEVKVGPSIVKLDRRLVEGWEQKWLAPMERFELNGGVGTPYTKAEKEAGEDGSRLLTQEDGLPQTLFRVVPKPGNAILIAVPLRIVRKQ